jgi:hypothetical protein
MIFRVFFINNEDYPNANEVSLAISVEKIQLNEVCVLDSLEKFLWPTHVLSQSALTLILTYPLQQ